MSVQEGIVWLNNCSCYLLFRKHKGLVRLQPLVVEKLLPLENSLLRTNIGELDLENLL
jgi:hypothetical protein